MVLFIGNLKASEMQPSLPPTNLELHEEKELTKLMDKICPGFTIDDCSFKVSKKKSRKAGTLRHVGFFEFGVPTRLLLANVPTEITIGSCLYALREPY